MECRVRCPSKTSWGTTTAFACGEADIFLLLIVEVECQSAYPAEVTASKLIISEMMFFDRRV
jgi:hypothetical protein